MKVKCCLDLSCQGSLNPVAVIDYDKPGNKGGIAYVCSKCGVRQGDLPYCKKHGELMKEITVMDGSKEFRCISCDCEQEEKEVE